MSCCAAVRDRVCERRMHVVAEQERMTMSEMPGMSEMFGMSETPEPDLVAEIYEQVAVAPLDRQLRVLEFVWLNAASHARTSQAGSPEAFTAERDRQLATLDRMMAIVRADVSGL
jgi:hypothetical protein